MRAQVARHDPASRRTGRINAPHGRSNELLGRVISIAQVLAWSAIPLGAVIGGVAIDRSHNVVLIFAVIGLLVFLIPLGFSLTALGHSERYMPARQASQTSSTG